jgi:hypothetical protein
MSAIVERPNASLSRSQKPPLSVNKAVFFRDYEWLYFSLKVSSIAPKDPSVILLEDL